MKNVLRAASFFIAMCCIVSMGQAQKFGYVNSATILTEMPEVKQAEANLEAMQKQLQKKGQGMVEKLQQDYAVVQQKVERGELSPKQQEEEGKKLQTRQEEIAKFEQDMMKQLQDKRSELLDPIYKKVNDAIKAVATEQGFQFIFDQGVLLYSEETLDVSAMVKTKITQ